jgi:hypothetical protein
MVPFRNRPGRYAATLMEDRVLAYRRIGVSAYRRIGVSACRHVGVRLAQKGQDNEDKPYRAESAEQFASSSTLPAPYRIFATISLAR